jgi:hypothetical protein
LAKASLQPKTATIATTEAARWTGEPIFIFPASKWLEVDKQEVCYD